MSYLDDWLKWVVSASVLGGLLVVAGAASASPWLLGAEELVVSTQFGHQEADEQYLGDGGPEPYPLDGRYRTSSFTTHFRYGLTEEFELALSIPFKSVSYDAEPVILPGEGDDDLDDYQGRNFDFSREETGVGDVDVAARYQLKDGRTAGAVELNVNLPTGYERPGGTFGREPTDVESFEEDQAAIVRPENVMGAASLGDGQVDLEALFLGGAMVTQRTFLRFDGGYKLRTRGGGDQVVGRLKAGQMLGERVLLQVGSSVEYAVQEGDSIGVSVDAQDPELPAEEYDEVDNLTLRELPLDYDLWTATAGVIVRATDTVEAEIAYTRTLWGRNVARTHGFFVGIGTKFDLSQ